MYILNIMHSGGLQYVLLAWLLAIIYLVWSGFKSWNSGQIVGGSSSNPEIKELPGKAPVLSVWQFVFAFWLFLAWIIAFISIVISYKGV